jgi:restriction system protein
VLIMKLKMSEKSLFATLLRAPWWVSFAVMLALALVAGAFLPDAYKTAGMLGTFPFW